MLRNGILLAGCTLLVACYGCSSSPDDGSPVGPESDLAPSHTSPMGAWDGLQWSFDADDPAGWREAIGSTFQYIPDAEVAARFPGAFDSWDRNREPDFVAFLFASDLEFDAEMTPAAFAEPTPAGSEVVWDRVRYSVEVSGSSGSGPVVFGGFARLVFRQEGSFWYLVSWEDLEGAPEPWEPELTSQTLGSLRAVSAE